MTKATTSGGSGLTLTAVATAQLTATSASTVRGQRRRHAAGSTAPALITAAVHCGIPVRSAGAPKPMPYTSASSAVITQSIANQCAGRSRLSSGGRSGSMS